MNNDVKRCPYCGEEIMQDAIKCKHCGEWITHDARSEKQVLHITESRQTELDGQSGFIGCLLVLAIYGGIIAIIAFLLHVTVPNDSRMEKAIVEDVCECVVEEVDFYAGMFGDGLDGFASLFLSNDASSEIISQQFSEYNSVEIKRSWFWSTGKIYNADTPEGVTVCLGVCGIVIPFVSWEDFCLFDDE